MRIVKSVGIVLAWTVAGIVASVLVAYLPGALHVVDDTKWGRVVGSSLPLALVFLLVSGVLVANKKRALGFGLTGFVLAGYVAMDVAALVLARRP